MKKILLILAYCISDLLISQTNNALNFSGGDAALNYSAVLDFGLNDSFSIEAWVKTTESYAAIIFSNHVDQVPFVGTEAAIVNGKAVLEVQNNYVSNAIRAETQVLVNDGNWHHLVFIYKGNPAANSCVIYVDGVSQNLTLNPNNLTSTFVSGNGFHIGSRNNTAYFSDITIDELRIWKRVLCQQEIIARKNCTLKGYEPALEAYYTFDQGTGGASNSNITMLLDQTGNGHHATITGLALSGTTGNFQVSTVPFSGSCTAYSPFAVSGPTMICKGNSAILSVSGASAVSWHPGVQTGTSITVGPTVSATYTASGISVTGCGGTASLALQVSACLLMDQEQMEDTRLYFLTSEGKLRMDQSVDYAEVCSVTGQVLRKWNHSQPGGSIEVSDLPRAVYLLRIFSNGQVHCSRFIRSED